MGKHPSYLPAAFRTVGSMIAEGVIVTWHCNHGHYGPVDLQRIAERRSLQFSLVDKYAPCRVGGCNGTVYFRYSFGVGTPSRRLEALREREVAASVRASDERRLAQLRDLYNATAIRLGRPLLP